MVTLAGCEPCKGTGRVVGWFPEVGIGDDGDPIYGHTDTSTVVGWTEQVCSDCGGMAGPDGRTYARYRDRWDTYGQPYASASTLKAAITRGKAHVCRQCKGRGRTYRLECLSDCHQCGGFGQVVTGFAPGDVLPEGVDLYGSCTGHEVWAATVPLTIVRDPQAALTWGTANLGLGTVWTSVDYGRALGMTDEELTGKIRDGLAERHQWVKFTGKDTRQVAETVAVVVGVNGYAVVTTASREMRPMLPPTYTADVLNRPTA